MKQQITREQLDELSKVGITLFDNWMLDRGYVNEDMTIGQMIEFLKPWHIYYTDPMWGVQTDMSKEEPFKDELCDALWEAVKEVLK